MFGFFTTKVSKGELRSNMKYLQNLQKAGKEVEDKKILNMGSSLTLYREISEGYRNTIKKDVIGFEESVVKGRIDLKPFKDEWQIHISFPDKPFLDKFNGKTAKYNYPKKWSMPNNKNTNFTYRHRAIRISEECPYYGPEYYDYMYPNCKIYDCGNAYLLVGGRGDSLEKYTFVIEKTK